MIAEILRNYGLTLDYLRRLIADVPDERLTEQPAGAVNHPAWVIGHLVPKAARRWPKSWGSRTGCPTTGHSASAHRRRVSAMVEHAARVPSRRTHGVISAALLSLARPGRGHRTTPRP